MGKVIFKDISFRYGTRSIFENFNLEVEDGQILCLVGPSGCGKTTLARCLLGLNRPQTGEIFVGDRCLFSAEKRINVAVERRNIGMVFQDYAVWPHMTVKENVLYPLRKRRVPKEQAEKRAAHALAQVNMTEYATHLPSQLSGGQQQRVAIARALVCDGGLIVMDEPITNLDAKLREQMLMEIREIQRHLGTTILYITHDQQSALQLCDKMAVMQQDGSLCQVGTDEDIILRPANRFTFEFIGVSNFIPVAATDSGWGLDTGRGIVPWDGPLPETPDLSTGIELGVRPNDIVFDAASPLRAKVERRTFLGSEYDYHVTLGTRKLRVQQSTFDAARGGTANVGDEVGLRLLNPRFYQSKEEARP